MIMTYNIIMIIAQQNEQEARTFKLLYYRKLVKLVSLVIQKLLLHLQTIVCIIDVFPQTWCCLFLLNFRLLIPCEKKIPGKQEQALLCVPIKAWHICSPSELKVVFFFVQLFCKTLCQHLNGFKKEVLISCEKILKRNFGGIGTSSFMCTDRSLAYFYSFRIEDSVLHTIVLQNIMLACKLF